MPITPEDAIAYYKALHGAPDARLTPGEAKQAIAEFGPKSRAIFDYYAQSQDQGSSPWNRVKAGMGSLASQVGSIADRLNRAPGTLVHTLHLPDLSHANPEIEAMLATDRPKGAPLLPPGAIAAGGVLGSAAKTALPLVAATAAEEGVRRLTGSPTAGITAGLVAGGGTAGGRALLRRTLANAARQASEPPVSGPYNPLKLPAFRPGGFGSALPQSPPPSILQRLKTAFTSPTIPESEVQRMTDRIMPSTVAAGQTAAAGPARRSPLPSEKPAFTPEDALDRSPAELARRRFMTEMTTPVKPPPTPVEPEGIRLMPSHEQAMEQMRFGPQNRGPDSGVPGRLATESSPPDDVREIVRRWVPERSVSEPLTLPTRVSEPEPSVLPPPSSPPESSSGVPAKPATTSVKRRSFTAVKGRRPSTAVTPSASEPDLTQEPALHIPAQTYTGSSGSVTLHKFVPDALGGGEVGTLHVKLPGGKWYPKTMTKDEAQAVVDALNSGQMNTAQLRTAIARRAPIKKE